MVRKMKNGYGKNDISRCGTASRKDGGVEYDYHTGPCHSFLQRVNNIEVIFSSPNVKGWTTEARWTGGRHTGVPQWEFKEYYEEACSYWDWLMNASPWRDVYLTKPEPEEAGTVGVQIDCTVPNNVAMFAIIATRAPHEYPERIRAWTRGVRLGGDPMALLPLVEGIEVRSGLIMGADPVITFKKHGGGIHNMFAHDQMSDQGVGQFMRWEFDEGSENAPFTDAGRFDGVHSLFCQDVDLGLPFRQELRKIKAKQHNEVRQWNWGRGMEIVDDTQISFTEGVGHLVRVSKLIRRKYG